MVEQYNAQQYRHKALQDARELNEFCALVRAERVTSYLEIGCKHGGSLWYIANQLPKGATVVAVDLPHGDLSFKNSQPNLENCISDLKAAGYNTHLILGDSTDPGIIQRVRDLGPFDLCFIDANHTTKYCWSDWIHYGPLARLVAFHDIAQIEKQWPPNKTAIEVKPIWKKIKLEYRHKEISYCGTVNGIGILWRD